MHLSSSLKHRRVPQHGSLVSESSANTKRARSSLSYSKAKADAIMLSHKSFTVRQATKSHNGMPNECCVFVGNLSPKTTKEELVQRFSRCGTILDVQIRCSQGCIVSTDQEGYFSNVHYATLLFRENSAFDYAMSLTGGVLHGLPVIVSPTIGLLPETFEGADYQSGKVLTGYDPLSSSRSLKEQKTEVIYTLNGSSANQDLPQSSI